MTTVVTGAGLIGTAFAQNAIARGEKVVFVDPEPRADFLKLKLGDKGYALARYDVRDLPNLIATIKEHGADTVVHTAGLIGNRVQQSLRRLRHQSRRHPQRRGGGAADRRAPAGPHLDLRRL